MHMPMLNFVACLCLIFGVGMNVGFALFKTTRHPVHFFGIVTLMAMFMLNLYFGLRA